MSDALRAILDHGAVPDEEAIRQQRPPAYECRAAVQQGLDHLTRLQRLNDLARAAVSVAPAGPDR